MRYYIILNSRNRLPKVYLKEMDAFAQLIGYGGHIYTVESHSEEDAIKQATALGVAKLGNGNSFLGDLITKTQESNRLSDERKQAAIAKIEADDAAKLEKAKAELQESAVVV